MKTVKTAGLLLLSLLSAACIGTLLLCGAYALPTGPIDENVRKSAEILEKEGTYPSLFSWCLSTLDNFTDSYMLLEAADPTEEPLLQRALLNRPGVGSRDPRKALTDHYLGGEPFPEGTGYTRYWHGYQIWLKPLLSVTTYGGIRILNGIFQAGLTALVCFLLYRKNLKNLILPFLMTVLMLMPAALVMSLQFSACFDTAVLAMAALLSVKESRRPIVFLFTGIATAYFDLLTYPVFTFGMPAVLLLAMNPRETAGANLLRLVRAGLYWALGYAGMWALKWVIAGLFTNQDVIADALKQIGVRTSDLSQDDVTHVSAFECAGRNVLWFIRTPAAALPVLYAAWKGVSFLRSRKGNTPEAHARVLPYLAIALVPFVWFAVTINHSYMHIFFACKTLGVSVFAAAAWLASADSAPDPISNKRGELAL